MATPLSLTCLAASIFLVNVDNVGSNQMHQIRVALRGKGVVVMGKNTMVRRALRTILHEYPAFEKLLPYVKGNIGFVFTSSDLKEVRDLITANKVSAPARAGALAPLDVTIPAGNTGMEPGKTSFFQALGIPTKIARGTIEIVSDVKVVTAGTRVGASEATLLNLLNISPFTYGMSVVQIFDNGNVFSPAVLDVSEKELLDRLKSKAYGDAPLNVNEAVWQAVLDRERRAEAGDKDELELLDEESEEEPPAKVRRTRN